MHRARTVKSTYDREESGVKVLALDKVESLEDNVVFQTKLVAICATSDRCCRFSERSSTYAASSAAIRK